MTTCYVIRHADKETGLFFNPALRHQDAPISRVGRQRAEKMSGFFAEKSIGAIYISEYQRTAQTAEFLTERLRLSPIVDPRLNEFDSGLLDGLSESQIQTDYPKIWQGFQDRAYDFRFPEGETGAEARDRIAGFLEEKRKLHAHDSILAVCHEGLIRLMMCHITGMPVFKRGNFHVDFCGITEIRYQPEHASWKLMRFNQILME
jgi:broad specificity phosphatase PhoE